MIEYQQRFGPMALVTGFYNKIPPKSSTKQLVVDILAWTVRTFTLQVLGCGLGISYYTDFLLEVIRAMASKFMSEPQAKPPLEDWETSCKYHCHGDEKPCYRENSKRYIASLYSR
jgi:hypothetical protein